MRLAVAALLAACAAAPITASAQSGADSVRLTLDQARGLALQGNPDLLATRVDTSIARGELRQAALVRFNPTMDLLGAAGGNGAEASLSQEVELFGQRGARARTARRSLDRTRAGVENATRLTIASVDRLFYRLAATSRRAVLADEVLAVNERLQDVAQRQLVAGEISRLDLNLAIVELGRSRARALGERREQEQVMRAFARAVGLGPDTPIVAEIDTARGDGRSSDAPGLRFRRRSLDADSLTAIALARRPDLAEAEATRRQARAAVSLSRREALPNLILRLAGEPGADGTGRAVRGGVGITVPLLNRKQGEVQARRAATRQAELERAALLSTVRTEVAAAVASYRSAQAQVQSLETTVLSAARQNRQLVEIAYREGKVGLPVLLLIRNQAIDAELDYWTAWLAEREALATLSEATATNSTPGAGTGR